MSPVTVQNLKTSVFNSQYIVEYSVAISQSGLLINVSGDRWLVSCLGVLYLNKGLFYRVVPADQSFNGDQYCGLFRFRLVPLNHHYKVAVNLDFMYWYRLWWCGEWTEVLVDDRLPTVHGRLAFLQSQNSDYYWPGLLEKAYAK